MPLRITLFPFVLVINRWMVRFWLSAALTAIQGWKDRAVEHIAQRKRLAHSISNRTRARTSREERIPCVRLGRYVRFEWGSLKLEEWLEKKRQ